MTPPKNNRPIIIIFAQSPSERDYLRDMLSALEITILCFEKEATCFDNLISIHPQLIVVRTDSKTTVWRFALALNALKLDARLLHLSSAFDAHNLNVNHVNIMTHSLPWAYEPNNLADNIHQMLTINESPPKLNGHGVLLGTNPAIKSINSKLQSLAQAPDPVLIEGEAGTGKELLARMIVDCKRDNSILLKIDCKALAVVEKRPCAMPGGCLYEKIYEIFVSNQVAKKPVTILLDKIDHLDQRSQSELLLLWEKDFNFHADVRFIATSETDLAHRVRHDRFRKELFYRLNVIPLHMPALRERREDIPLMTDHFAIEACTRLRRSFLFPTPHLSGQLTAYHWPGNLDELKCSMDRLAASGDEGQILQQSGFQSFRKNPCRNLYNAVGADTIPDLLEIRSCLSNMGNTSLKSICDQFTHKTEKKLLRRALETTNWNRKKAASLLHISYKSMLNKMKMYEII
jgi:DNA-binding NtrC family response regulator